MNGHRTPPHFTSLTTEVESSTVAKIYSCAHVCASFGAQYRLRVCSAKRHVAIASACLPFLAGKGAAVAELRPLVFEPVTSWGMMMGFLEAIRLLASSLLTFRQAMTLPYWLSCRQVSSISTCMAISLRNTPCTSFLLQRAHGAISSVLPLQCQKIRTH